MKITCETHGTAAVLSIHGDLSMDEVESFRKEAASQIQADMRDFVLDLSQLDLVDSSGLEALLWLQDRCAEILGQVRLAACSEHLTKVFEVTRLAARFECYADVDSAIQSLGYMEASSQDAAPPRLGPDL